MEWKFGKESISCLDMPVCQVSSTEQTQEMRLPDGLPDIGTVISAWGQGILRSKQWHGDQAAVSGGVLVWILYEAEDGSGVRVLDGWMPVQLSFDLPADLPEGDIRVMLRPKFVDARVLSPRKLMIRAGVTAHAEVCSPCQVELYTPSEANADMVPLENTYPVRLNREAGEKEFSLEEQWQLPESVPASEELIYGQLDPVVTEEKLLSNKLVFRGDGKLHLLYRSREGQFYTWDFSLPFSQFVQLGEEYGQEAQGDVVLMPTGLELSLDEEGSIRCKCSMMAQYMISQRKLLPLVQDVFSSKWELEVDTLPLRLPGLLDQRREDLTFQESLNGDANIVVDARFLPEYPRQHRTEDSAALEIPGKVQLLYYDSQGKLRGSTMKINVGHTMKADPNSVIRAIPGSVSVQAGAENDRISVKGELPLELTAMGGTPVPMVTGVKLLSGRIPDPNRPSLVLRRAGEDSLWHLARDSGSTVEAIRRCNGLTGEPEPGRMLLIPVL